MSGLDDLVAEAMKRKLVPAPPPLDGLAAAPVGVGEELPPTPPPALAVPAPDAPVKKGAVTKALPRPDDAKADTAAAESPHPDSMTAGRAPAISIPFAVNGVKCIVTIHVEAGAVVTEPPTHSKKAPSSGVKVKGIRGAKTEEPEETGASEAVFDKKQPIGDDNLPEGWVYDPVVGATLPEPASTSTGLSRSTSTTAPTPEPPKNVWLCPDHALAEERTSTITGRTYTVCPECGKLAPR